MNKTQAISEEIKSQISEGIWSTGERLPSLRDVARRYGVSLITVMYAYQLLQDENIIISREKSGYFVLNDMQPMNVGSDPARKRALKAVRHFDDKSEYIHSVIQQSVSATIPFGSAFPDPLLLPHKKMKKALLQMTQQFDPVQHSNILPPGDDPLREKISQRYTLDGMQIPKEAIVITAGALDALGLCLQAVTEPGDAVIVEDPCFSGVLQQVSRLRLNAVPVKSSLLFGTDLAELEQILSTTPVKAMLLMANVQNPVGFTLLPPVKKQLAALLEKYGVIAIEDDVYGEMYSPGEKSKPACAYFAKKGWMHCGSFSKTLTTDYRVGWIASFAYHDKLQRLQLMNTLTVSPVAQLTVDCFLSANGYDHHLRGLRRELELRKDFAWRKLKKYFPPEVKVHYSRGGYFLWIELPEFMDADEIFAQSIAKGISIAPGRMFSLTNSYRHCFRFNASLLWNNLVDNGAKTLGMIISQALTV